MARRVDDRCLEIVVLRVRRAGAGELIRSGWMQHSGGMTINNDPEYRV
jgi:hypothetical protein